MGVCECPAGKIGQNCDQLSHAGMMSSDGYTNMTNEDMGFILGLSIFAIWMVLFFLGVCLYKDRFNYNIELLRLSY